MRSSVISPTPRFASIPAGLLLVSALLCGSSTLGANQSDRICLNDGWRFSADRHWTAQFPETPDDSWESVSLPHTPPAIDESRGDPFLRDRTRPCWYRRHLSLSEHMADKRVYLHFEDIDTQFRIWINGHPLDEPPAGKSTLEYDITRRFNFGDQADNVLAIQNFSALSPTYKFPGSQSATGIWLRVRSPIHVVDESLTIVGPMIIDSSVRVRIDSAIINATSEAAEITLLNQVFEPGGELLAASQMDFQMASGATVPTTSQLSFSKDDTTAALQGNGFEIVLQVIQSGEVIDRVEVVHQDTRPHLADQTSPLFPPTAN